MTDTKTTTNKGEAAVKHLWRRAIEEGDEARAQAEAHREEDAERNVYYREHPEAAPSDWDPERGYR